MKWAIRAANLAIFLGVALLVLSFYPVINDEFWYFFRQIKHQQIILSYSGVPVVTDSPFARLLSTRPITIVPVNKDFSIVIEKLGVNAPIKADVTVTDTKAYNVALKEGVAHASTSDYPSQEPGNVTFLPTQQLIFGILESTPKFLTLFENLKRVM